MFNKHVYVNDVCGCGMMRILGAQPKIQLECKITKKKKEEKKKFTNYLANLGLDLDNL